MNPNTLRIAQLVNQCDLEPGFYQDPGQKFPDQLSDQLSEHQSEQFNTGPWNTYEQQCFIEGIERYGRNWRLISKEIIKTRSRCQVASHAQKYFASQIKKQQKTLKYHCYTPFIIKGVTTQ
jgi:SHAQKYF class myb-like DNA-binding protein